MITLLSSDWTDLWKSPFTLGFLSVGFRRFRSSIPGVSEFLEDYRPDVLFLGDLGTGQNKIGRLKLPFEERVNEEWFLWTNIQNAAGYSIGSGAAIRASAAKHILKWDMVCPAGIDKEQWLAAAGGRLLCLKLFRPEMSGPLFLLGENQHVALDSNIVLRRIFMQTVANMKTLALACGGQFALIGDMNAAPDRGRWGYSSRSKTHEADCLTLEWAHQCCLEEVSNAQSHATWKACLHPRRATLDQALGVSS